MTAGNMDRINDLILEEYLRGRRRYLVFIG